MCSLLKKWAWLHEILNLLFLFITSSLKLINCLKQIISFKKIFTCNRIYYNRDAQLMAHRPILASTVFSNIYLVKNIPLADSYNMEDKHVNTFHRKISKIINSFDRFFTNFFIIKFLGNNNNKKKIIYQTSFCLIYKFNKISNLFFQ